jgi:hypothetical protein
MWSRAIRCVHSLRNDASAFAQLHQPTAARVVVALYGVPQSKRLAPMLDVIARNLQPRE